MRRAVLALLAAVLPGPLLAGGAEGTCDTAIVFAIDVSNSVIEEEYRFQVEGLATAFRDPEVIEALVEGQVAVAVLQWSGPRDQRLSIPWREIRAPSDALLLAGTVLALPRAFERSGTAPAEAVRRALGVLAEAPPCGRHVIDVSGDGVRNGGGDVTAARDEAVAVGVTINGIAIEILGRGVTAFYRERLITPGGFVVTARGHADYPPTLRAKILRELAPPVG